MLTLFRTEMLKLTTTRWPWILVAGRWPPLRSRPCSRCTSRAETGTPPSARWLPSWRCSRRWAAARLVALLLGVLMVTSEFRHNTVTASLLESPRRGRVVTAKALVAVSVGLALGLAGLAIVLAVGL